MQKNRRKYLNFAPDIHTSTDMLHYFFSTLPFEACLFWLVVLTVKFREHDAAKRMLTLFAAACTILYLCHALYFLGHNTRLSEVVWAYCSLSVYPIYYLYLCRLTSSKVSPITMAAILMPGLVVATTMATMPGEATELVRKVVFMGQVIGTFILGTKRLKQFDREINEVYSNTEKKDTRSLQVFLACFIATSCLSAIASSIGRNHFLPDNAGEWWMVAIPSVLFTTMLFILFHIGYSRNFTIEQYEQDKGEPKDTGEQPSANNEENMKLLAERLRILMDDKQMFLQKDLKIGDVANELGVCRTYVSNCINQCYEQSFSDLINSLRIAHAEQMLRAEGESTKMLYIALESGYSNEQSFYRNFKKITGKSPSEWLRDQDK